MDRIRRCVFLLTLSLLCWTIEGNAALLCRAVTPDQAAAQEGGHPDAAFGPRSVWQPSDDFVTTAHQACDRSPGGPANYGRCFLAQM
jgi:hypothetical protein